MKIVILNSPLFKNKNPLYDEDSLPPIGLGLIATSLKENGFDVQLIDAVAENIPLQELIEKMHEIKPAFLCTNIFTTNLELVKELIESINFPTQFVIGGLSTQSLCSQIFKWNTNNPFDIVHGDGEKIILDIVKKQVKQLPTIEVSNRRYYKVDRNSFYFDDDISTEKLDRTFFVNEPVDHIFGFKEANIITSRGCIYNCAFCAAASSLNRDFGTREKSVESIKNEIRHLINIYPEITSIRVLDDLFLKNGTTVNKAIEVFSNFQLQWRSMAHVQTFKGVSEETIRSLKSSGCSELFIGIESGSPKILKEIHKTQDTDLIKENLSKLLQNGINVKGYFIFGFPKETKEDMEMTYSLAKYLKDISIQFGSQFRTSVFHFRPYHGTELYHTLKEQFGDSTFDHVSAVEPEKELSDLVGRLQFNFHSGNYSEESIEMVRNFVYRTTNLNHPSIFDPHAERIRNSEPNKVM